jgi:hypothetical protein
VAEVNGLTTSFTETNLQPGWRYYAISAVNTAGEGARSATREGLAYWTYRVELKAFIPFTAVVDPKLIDEAGYTYADARSTDDNRVCHSAAFQSAGATVYGYFHGDSHPEAYEGSHRVRAAIEFKWEGSSIWDARDASDDGGLRYGETQRLRRYVGFQGIQSEACVLDALTVNHASSAYLTSGRTFMLEYDSPNPFYDSSFMPDVDGWLRGTFADNGDLLLDYETDQFPEHAYRVTRNGAAQLTAFPTDVTCLTQSEVLGWDGFTNLGNGLRQGNGYGTDVVHPSDSDRTPPRTPSGLC